MGEIQFHGADSGIASCFLFFVFEASMELVALFCDLYSQFRPTVGAVASQLLGE